MLIIATLRDQRKLDLYRLKWTGAQSQPELLVEVSIDAIVRIDTGTVFHEFDYAAQKSKQLSCSCDELYLLFLHSERPTCVIHMTSCQCWCTYWLHFLFQCPKTKSRSGSSLSSTFVCGKTTKQNKTKHRLTYYPRIETFMLKQILCWAKFWQIFKDPWTLIPCNVPLFIAFSVGHRIQNCIAQSPHTEKPWLNKNWPHSHWFVCWNLFSHMAPSPTSRAHKKHSAVTECVTRTATYCQALWPPSTLHTLPYSPLCLRL